MLLEEKINLARKICNRKFLLFNAIDFNKIYSFPTENVNGYINKFNLENKSLLTVGSSSDQVINAISNGCKDITLVDINPFIKEYYYLKKVAILNLSREEFFDYFCKTNNSYLDKKIYERIKENLYYMDKESYDFWNTLYDYKINNLFINSNNSRRKIEYINNYLKDNKSYEKTKIRIKDINPIFINEDISKVKINRKFDNIFLSNLFDHIDRYKIIDKSIELLNDNGEILLYYIFGTTLFDDNISINELYDPRGIISKMPNESKFIQIPSSESNNYCDKSKDGIIVYKKSLTNC